MRFENRESKVHFPISPPSVFGWERGSVNGGGQSGRPGRTISRHRHPPAIFPLNSPQTTQNTQKWNRGKNCQFFFGVFDLFCGSYCSWRHAFRETFTTDFTDFTDGKLCIWGEGICKRLMSRGFRWTMQEKAGKMPGETEDATGENRENRVKGMIVKGIKIRKGGHRVGAERGSGNGGGQGGRLGRIILRQRHRNLRHRHPPARQCWKPVSGRPKLYYNTIN